METEIKQKKDYYDSKKVHDTFNANTDLRTMTHTHKIFLRRRTDAHFCGRETGRTLQIAFSEIKEVTLVKLYSAISVHFLDFNPYFLDAFVFHLPAMPSIIAVFAVVFVVYCSYLLFKSESASSRRC